MKIKLLFSASPIVPICHQAKMTFHSISDFQYKVVEMDDGNHEGWQPYVAELAENKGYSIGCQ